MKNILLGAVSLDIYKDEGIILPGGGCLNMAYHWQQLGFSFQFLTRIGQDQLTLFLDFFDTHKIDYLPQSVVGIGQSAAIEIAFSKAGQPTMDNFVEGVWADFELTAVEQTLVSNAKTVHTVLVTGTIRELIRLGNLQALTKPLVSADFLDFRHFSAISFAQILPFVDVGFIGWPRERNDKMLGTIRQIVFEQKKLLIVTLGAKGVLVFDGREGNREQFFEVDAIPVKETAVGCGDAFIAYFLAEFNRNGNIAQAVERGKIGGALATAWQRPLPNEAYLPDNMTK